MRRYLSDRCAISVRQPCAPPDTAPPSPRDACASLPSSRRPNSCRPARCRCRALTAAATPRYQRPAQPGTSKHYARTVPCRLTSRMHNALNAHTHTHAPWHALSHTVTITTHTARNCGPPCRRCRLRAPCQRMQPPPPRPRGGPREGPRRHGDRSIHPRSPGPPASARLPRPAWCRPRPVRCRLHPRGPGDFS